METLLQGIDHTSVYLDDILVTGATDEEHLRNLDQVLARLEGAGMRLKRKKCEFMLPEVEYLGHRITSQGLQPTGEKVRAITNAPTPENKAQLQSFLGLINYYAKFLPNLSTTLAPVYALLHKKTSWVWGDKEARAFEMAKSQLTTSSILVHYSSDRDLLLACDASPYGVGAVLSHRMDDGTDKPIAFASRSLTPAERNYAQLDSCYRFRGHEIPTISPRSQIHDIVRPQAVEIPIRRDKSGATDGIRKNTTMGFNPRGIRLCDSVQGRSRTRQR